MARLDLLREARRLRGLPRFSALAMQPACRRVRRFVARTPSRNHRRVKSMLLNMLLHAQVDQPGDRLAIGAPLPDRS